MSSSASDVSLIARVVMMNDNRAFDQLVIKYQSIIRSFFIHQTLGNKELSDDLAQETFIKAYVNIASFKNLSEFSTWLIRIAYNVYYDYIRANHSNDFLDTNEAINLSYNENKDLGKEMDIFQALQILKKEERTCIILFYMDDLSIENISVITQMPQGTVKSHLSRGKEKMAVWLKNNGYE